MSDKPSKPTEDQQNDTAASQNDGNGNRTMSQEEIDKLLGNTPEAKAKQEKQQTGMERVIKAGYVSFERLPMLEVIVDRYVRLLSSTLRNMANETIDIRANGIQSVRFGDFIDMIPTASLFIVFKALQWGNYGLMIMDNAIAGALINLLMGSPRSSELKKDGLNNDNIPARPMTAIEHDLLERMIKHALVALSTAFGPAGKIDFQFDRMEASARFATIARPTNASVTITLNVGVEDVNGKIYIVLPYATLEPVRAKLAEQFAGEKFGKDSMWEEHLLSEIMETDARISATFAQREIPLGEALALKEGSLLTFPHKKGSPFNTTIQCGRTKLFKGHLGRIEKKLAIEIDAWLIKPENVPKSLTKEQGSLTQHKSNSVPSDKEDTSSNPSTNQTS